MMFPICSVLSTKWLLCWLYPMNSTGLLWTPMDYTVHYTVHSTYCTVHQEAEHTVHGEECTLCTAQSTGLHKTA